MSKQDLIHQNAKKFNQDCVAFHMDLQDLENNIPQSAWEMVATNIAQDDRTTNVQGCYTLQNEQQEKEDTIDAVSHIAPEIQQIHSVHCMQKQQKCRVLIFRTIADMYAT